MGQGALVPSLSTNRTVASRAEAEARRLREERARTRATVDARARAVGLLRECAAERAWKRAADALGWAGGTAAGLALLVVLASFADVGVDARWSAVPSAVAAVCAVCATLFQGGKVYDLADAVVCDEALAVLNMMMETGLSGHEGMATFLRRYERRFDAIGEASGRRRKAMMRARDGEAGEASLAAATVGRGPPGDDPRRDGFRGDIRKFERIVPAKADTTVTFGGRMQHARIIDVSRSGVALDIAIRPEPGTSVLVGRRKAVAVRAFQRGFGFEFAEVVPDEAFGPDFRP